MATLTFEADFRAEASVVTAADKLAAIRRYATHANGAVDRTTLLQLLDGHRTAMKVWGEPSTDGTTEHLEITES